MTGISDTREIVNQVTERLYPKELANKKRLASTQDMDAGRSGLSTLQL